MRAARNVSLKAFNTLAVEAHCRRLLTIECESDLPSIPRFDRARDVILGGGSNVVFVSDVPGTVIANRLLGKSFLDERNGQVLVEVGAGENWHDLVRWSIDQGLCGLENLSLIPGLAGAAPVQNIGAYGVELSSVLDSVLAWDLERGEAVAFSHAECRLAYRDSRFKSAEPDRYLITSIRLRLAKEFAPVLGYAGLREELGPDRLDGLTAREVSDAVIRLRRRKLPDPAKIGNAGSFFKNPEIEEPVAEALRIEFPGLPVWPADGGLKKISAAWMIETCGLKGIREGDAGISEKNALVLVNHGNASGAQVLKLAERVRQRVLDAFGVPLEAEPRLIRFDPA